MPGLNDLYQEILLDHNSKPRHYRKLEEANRSADEIGRASCRERV